MSPATNSSERLWTQERFLTRQVDKLEMWKQVFKGPRVLGGHLAGGSSPRDVEWMRASSIMCVAPSVPLWEGECTFLAPKNSHSLWLLGRQG